ncbi:(Fe-S)-binding protein [Schaalia sp. lx-260]|uniref:(Fe-S)-binding protein n=1 Tax=Schaalia sp. lx-260 TaxID=2899082 RepID=UPI001E628070|nr:(Fe-S)-binding protein [Schaalia sp. lx-260]MCD4548875.1 Fe-S oxidoreductase [Schaalia sp. lx-260]
MATPILSVVSWVFALFASLFALMAFSRGLMHLWRQFSSGGPEPERTTPVFQRLGTLMWTILSHREFRGRPWVKVAHWLVMFSFPLLFLTLISAYVHLRDQLWALPFIGHFAPWEWVVEFFAWAGLIGIIVLMRRRRQEGSGSIAEAAMSGPHPSHEDSSDLLLRRRGHSAYLASRFLGSTRWQALFVEWVILIVCACIVLLRIMEYALLVTVDTGISAAIWWHYPLTSWAGMILGPSGFGLSVTVLANCIVLVALLKILTSMLWMMVVGVQTSMGVAWHRFLAIANIYARRNPDGSQSLGPAAPMLINGSPVTSPDDCDDLPDDAVLGTGTVEDLSWKDRLDFYTCTECGRCQELCPAWNTAKPLSPKLFVLSMRDHIHSVSRMELSEQEIPETDTDIQALRNGDQSYEHSVRLLEKGLEPTPHSLDLLDVLAASGATGPLGVADVQAPLVPNVISEEALWDCTMCGACVEQCPVDIEHIDHIIDLRRHQVLMEAAFPKELGRAFRGMESKANPYNQPARKRMEWAKNLDFEVPVIGIDVESAEDVDWVFWVGCAGAFDDRGRATSAAIAELLHVAGVSFAVLGQAESCTGDPARRAGNEPLFQMLAAAAIETLHDAHVTKIVVSCAHCFNTIAGEFPQLGGRFEVVHHTQLLNRLVREGLLVPVAPTSDEDASSEPVRVTYHDPCFLGRHNQIYEAPRELVSSLPGVDMVEMPRNRDRAMCCGAGGAHAWFEESRGTRIADARIVEAQETGADIVATACPFCSQMLGSATGASVADIIPPAIRADMDGSAMENTRVGGQERGKTPEVRDVAIMLRDAVRRGFTQ